MKTSLAAGILVAVFSLTTLTSALAGSAQGDVSDVEFLSFNLADPEQDAADALAHGHPHCYSVNGYSKSFPGVDAANVNFCKRVERNISGTSDIHAPEHEMVNREAIPYATAYNRYIIAHVRDLHSQ